MIRMVRFTDFEEHDHEDSCSWDERRISQLELAVLELQEEIAYLRAKLRT